MFSPISPSGSGSPVSGLALKAWKQGSIFVFAPANEGPANDEREVLD